MHGDGRSFESSSLKPLPDSDTLNRASRPLVIRDALVRFEVEYRLQVRPSVISEPVTDREVICWAKVVLAVSVKSFSRIRDDANSLFVKSVTETNNMSSLYFAILLKSLLSPWVSTTLELNPCSTTLRMSSFPGSVKLRKFPLLRSVSESHVHASCLSWV